MRPMTSPTPEPSMGGMLAWPPGDDTLTWGARGRRDDGEGRVQGGSARVGRLSWGAASGAGGHVER